MAYIHGEAFHIMHYQCNSGCCNEFIWNSRDGVTPFIVSSRRGHEMHHIRWQEDYLAPNHRPEVGDRIFVDATRELLHHVAVKYVNDLWDRDPYPMKDAYASMDEAIQSILDHWCEPGQPHLLEVVEEKWTPKEKSDG